MDHWTDGYVETNGITVHYIRTGGNKPQVVLCHGFSDNGACWTALAKELEADYDVIMVDARCHGKSDAPEAGNNASAMADDLAGLITALGLDRPVVAGHSMGATYTELFAARRPDLLRGLVLEDSPWREPPPAGADAQAAAAMKERFDSWKAEFEGYQEQPLEECVAKCKQDHPNWEPGTCELFMQAKKQLNFSIFNGRLLSMGGWQENLPKITCPILEFTGDPELGAIVTDEMYAKASPLAKDIERVHIAGVGHHIRYAAPQAYTQAFKAFLAKVYG